MVTREERIAAFKAFRAEKAAELRTFKLSLGLCGDLYCLNDAKENSARCEKHLAINRVAVRRINARQGKTCDYCSEPAATTIENILVCRKHARLIRD